MSEVIHVKSKEGVNVNDVVMIIIIGAGQAEVFLWDM